MTARLITCIRRLGRGFTRRKEHFYQGSILPHHKSIHEHVRRYYNCWNSRFNGRNKSGTYQAKITKEESEVVVKFYRSIWEEDELGELGKKTKNLLKMWVLQV
jgi:hypothetical protein